MWAKDTAPEGWLLCNGAAVSRSTYASLFTAIGTTFGSGDGSTTFNVPDFRGRAPIGVGQGTGLTNRALAATGGEEEHDLISDEMPAHTHTVPFSTGGGATLSITGTGSTEGTTDNETTSSTGSGNGHNNMQPFLAINFIIKT